MEGDVVVGSGAPLLGGGLPAAVEAAVVRAVAVDALPRVVHAPLLVREPVVLQQGQLLAASATTHKPISTSVG